MPRYRFIGDSPRDIPSHGLTNVQPGDVVDVAEEAEEIRHPDFALIPEKQAAKAAAKEE